MDVALHMKYLNMDYQVDTKNIYLNVIDIYLQVVIIDLDVMFEFVGELGMSSTDAINELTLLA